MSGEPPNRDLLASMLHAAEDKLEAAKHQLAGEFFGDAASRAYYAVLHAITCALALKGIVRSTHGQSLGEFNRQFVMTGVFPPDTYKKTPTTFRRQARGRLRMEP